MAEGVKRLALQAGTAELKCLALFIKMGTAACACNSSAKSGDRKILGVHWLVSLDEAVSFWPSKCLSQSSVEEDQPCLAPASA